MTVNQSERPEVEIAVSPFLVRFVASSRWLREFVNKIASRIGHYVPETGRAFSPYSMAIETVFMFIMSLPLFVIGVLFSILIHPIFFVFFAVPPILLFLPWIRIRSWIGERKRSIEEELPFFSIHASVLQAAGRDIYNALCSLIGRNAFPQIERDASIMRRNTTYFRMGPIEGVEELGRTIPNPKMSSLLLGYTSEWRSGGDAKRYLERKTDEFLKDAEDRWNKYTNDVSYIGEITIAIMFLAPLLLLMSIFLSPDVGSSIAIIFLTMILPVLSALSVGLIHSIQPKSYDTINGSIILGAVFAILGAIVALGVSTQTWLLIIAPLTGLFFGYGLPVIFQMRELSAHETALTPFLRDVTEYQKMGYDIVRATIKISSENKYNAHFDHLLARVAWQLNLGHRFSEIKFQTRSWLTRAAFFHLSEVAESGAYETASLEMLTNFINNVTRTKKKTKSSMTLYRVLSMLTPVFLAIVVGVLVGILHQFLINPVSIGTVNVPLMPEFSPYLLSLSYAIVIVASIGVSITSMYAYSFTLKNTTLIAVNTALAGIGIIVSQLIISILPTFMV